MLLLFRSWPLCFQNSIDTNLSLSCTFYVFLKNRDLKCITLGEPHSLNLAESYSYITWLLCMNVATHTRMENNPLYHLICLFLRCPFLCLLQLNLFKKKLSLRLRILQTVWNCCSLPPLPLKDCRWTCLFKGLNLNLVPIFSASGKQPSSLSTSILDWHTAVHRCNCCWAC